MEPSASGVGDSRGHWEDETLVVETTNLSEKSSFRGSSANLHLVERFTRVSPDTIRYEFTVEDPETWTRPWNRRGTDDKDTGSDV